MKKEILCTLGPASMNERVIARLEELGVSLFRINLSHTRLEDVASVIRFLQNRTAVPLCLDSEGAQIRTGNLLNGKVSLSENSIVRIQGARVLGDEQNFNLYPEDVIEQFKTGDFISIDFNSVLAQVIEKKPDCVVLRIVSGGLIGENKAVTLERDIAMPPLTKKDRQALTIAVAMGIRYVALSFAGKASDVDEIRSVAAKEVYVISKVESVKGIINLEEIAAKSDAILLDRGDLSHQVPIERIPRIQKDVIRRAKESGVKIYVATNLLESMVTKPVPTRAEINDIFNTLNDDADGLVLAAETAIGAYPVKCAAMVVRTVRQFLDFPSGYSSEELQRKDCLLLVEPHGGVLINGLREDFDKKQIKEYKALKVDKMALLDAEQIALGTFSPLEGFMTKEELESVLRDYRLPNAVVWPLPILLQTSKEEASKLKPKDKVALFLEDSGEAYAILHLTDIYNYDLDKISQEIFGTTHCSHPGVQLLNKRGNLFLGGKIELVKRLDSECKHLEITPKQARAIFESKGWSRVVGFHTRNVLHRVHEHMQMFSFKKYNCDGLFIHPIIGPKKKGDYSAGIILKSYNLMLDKYYPKGKTVLAAFQNYSRYSGPREAIFTALCRKNFGCSHFIVGRDHTGAGNFYKSDDAHKLFNYLGDIGITPIFFNQLSYCKQCESYVEECRQHGSKNILNISGTEGRQMLRTKKCPPDWFMREDIARFVLNEIEKGNEVFVQ